MDILRRPLRTVALVKQVPLGDHPGTLSSDGRLRRDGFEAEMNPWCRRAVARAIELSKSTGGRSTIITMGPPTAVDVLREAVACGADDGLHICDSALAGADCLITAKALAAAVRSLGPVDLVLVGRSTVDGSTGAVGPMVAALLGLPFAGPVLSIDPLDDGSAERLHVTLQLDGATETVDITLPAVISVAERSCSPASAPSVSWPDSAPIRRLAMADLVGADPGTASPTEVVRVRSTPTTRRPVILSGSPADQVARALELVAERKSITSRHSSAAVAAARVPSRRVNHSRQLHSPFAVLAVTGSPDESGARALIGEAAALAARVGGHVVAVCPKTDVSRVAAWGADVAVELTSGEPRPTAAALADWIRRDVTPWAVVGGATEWDREVLSRLAVHLDTGLICDLVSVDVQADDHSRPRIAGLKPSGNGTLVEIISRGHPQIATLRTGSLAMREPRPAPFPTSRHILEVDRDPHIRRTDRHVQDDYDAIERADVVIGVGAGVDPARYAEIEPLCTLLGAELAATRKVTDAGSLAHSRQLGITGRSVAPWLYVALGISGNRNHMIGVDRAHTILAVNSNPDAPVFAHCDIGIVADWQNVVPALIVAIERMGRLNRDGTVIDTSLVR